MGVTSWSDEQDAILLGGLKADRTYMQIADRLGMSKAMVSGRIYRLRKLRPQDVPPRSAQPVREAKFDMLPLRSSQKIGGEALESKLKARGCVSRAVREIAREKSVIEKSLIKRRGGAQAPTGIREMRRGGAQAPTGIRENAPLSFLQLERGQCSWQVGDCERDGSDQIMCCAAPVIDKTRREGDRRASHCAYHYELGTKRLS